MTLIKLNQALPGLSKAEETFSYFDRLGRACYLISHVPDGIIRLVVESDQLFHTEDEWRKNHSFLYDTIRVHEHARMEH